MSLKPVDFFVKKSEFFLENLNAFPTIEFPKKRSENYNDDFKLYEKQKTELLKVKFQIKLMYSEFDNGLLFTERIENFKPDSFDDNVQLKFLLIENIKLFLEFLKEYRV